MAYDKIVDSAKLDADLTMVADAIRARAGTSEPLAFPEGMKDAVEGIEDAMAMRCNGTLYEYKSDLVTTVSRGSFAFINTKKCELPNAVSLALQAFCENNYIETIIVPSLEEIGPYALFWANHLKELRVPYLKAVTGEQAMVGTSRMNLIMECRNGVPTLATDAATNAFTYSGIMNGTNYVYVPRTYVDEIKSATNWSSIADKIRILEDYTVDGTVTGELDPNKI